MRIEAVRNPDSTFNRHLLMKVLRFTLLLLAAADVAAASVHQATGIKIGEVTGTGAIVWTRLTRHADALADGVPFAEIDTRPAIRDGRAEGQVPAGRRLDEMQHAVPGAAGEVRLHWAPESAPAGAGQATPWTTVEPACDFTRQFELAGLEPGRWYRLQVESRDLAGAPGQTVEGRFKTVPAAESVTPVRFIVTTCHDDWRRDNAALGFDMYVAAKRWSPDFFVQTGDFVYLDKAYPFATDAALARFKWNRTSAWPAVREFYRGATSYFLKDDHDVLRNDSHPGMVYGGLTWEQGLAIEREQLPLPRGQPYRTFRWGRDLQIWLLESREFRSREKTIDGPGRTVLGAEQKRWLFETLRASDATFRIVITGTPIVGPNVDYKAGERGDSLADEAFRTEGEEVRRFLAAQPNTVVITGDRHWQYHSVDPETGLHEFGCGPACFGMAEGFVGKVRRSPMHRFLRIDGGFFSGEVERRDGRIRLAFRHHDTHGRVLDEHLLAAAVP
jgi:alkaline phosphatase D